MSTAAVQAAEGLHKLCSQINLVHCEVLYQSLMNVVNFECNPKNLH